MVTGKDSKLVNFYIPSYNIRSTRNTVGGAGHRDRGYTTEEEELQDTGPVSEWERRVVLTDLNVVLETNENHPQKTVGDRPTKDRIVQVCMLRTASWEMSQGRLQENSSSLELRHYHLKVPWMPPVFLHYPQSKVSLKGSRKTVRKTLMWCGRAILKGCLHNNYLTFNIPQSSVPYLFNTLYCACQMNDMRS